MSDYACRTCGQAWPANYCPVCGATIDRSLLAAPAAPAASAPAASAPAASATAPPRPGGALAKGLGRPSRSRPAGASLAPARSGSGPPLEPAPIEFAGSAAEYFRIWIVGVALSVLTLGIYSAWAKVRKRRYFWGSTRLAGRAFEYTGHPVAILKGHLVFAAAAVAWYVASRLAPRAGLVAIVGLALAVPWLLHNSLRFNAYNTRYRNIRFGFGGTVGESYLVNLGLALALPLSLGLLWPWVQYRRARYRFGNLSYGNAPFRFDGDVGDYYACFLRALGLVVVGLAAGFGLSVVIRLGWPGPGESIADLAFLVVTYATVVVALGVHDATRVANHTIGGISVEAVASLGSSMRVREVLALELVNLAAIVCSLGLAVPWASVRRARYRWSRIHVTFAGPIDRVTAALGPAPGALGEVFSDQLDIDCSL